MINKLINKIKTMAKIQMTPIVASDKVAAIEALQNYKRQNPVKFEQKKAALFAKYGLEDDTVVDIPKDETDIKLETIKAKASKKTNE